MSNITHIKCQGFTEEDLNDPETQALFKNDLHKLPRKDYHVFTCNDCGAYADTEAGIEHHTTCKPGDSEEWVAFYKRAEEEDI